MPHDCLTYINYKDSYKKLQLHFADSSIILQNCGILFSCMTFSQYLYFFSWSKLDNNNYFLRLPCGLNVLRHVKYLEWWLSHTQKKGWRNVSFWMLLLSCLAHYIRKVIMTLMSNECISVDIFLLKRLSWNKDENDDSMTNKYYDAISI